jgi:hypothetical protein
MDHAIRYLGLSSHGALITALFVDNAQSDCSHCQKPSVRVLSSVHPHHRWTRFFPEVQQRLDVQATGPALRASTHLPWQWSIRAAQSPAVACIAENPEEISVHVSAGHRIETTDTMCLASTVNTCGTPSCFLLALGLRPWGARDIHNTLGSHAGLLGRGQFFIGALLVYVARDSSRRYDSGPSISSCARSTSTGSYDGSGPACGAKYLVHASKDVGDIQNPCCHTLAHWAAVNFYRCTISIYCERLPRRYDSGHSISSCARSPSTGSYDASSLCDELGRPQRASTVIAERAGQRSDTEPSHRKPGLSH